MIRAVPAPKAVVVACPRTRAASLLRGALEGPFRGTHIVMLRTLTCRLSTVAGDQLAVGGQILLSAAGQIPVATD